MQTILVLTALLLGLEPMTVDSLKMRKLFAIGVHDVVTPSNTSRVGTHKKHALPKISPKQLLAYHNKVRREEGAANMIELVS